MDIQDDMRGKVVTSDRIVPNDPFKPTDDPLYPAPLPLAGSWQCPGCGMIYTMMVNSCACQTHRWSSASTTIRLYPEQRATSQPPYGTFTSEMP